MCTQTTLIHQPSNAAVCVTVNDGVNLRLFREYALQDKKHDPFNDKETMKAWEGNIVDDGMQSEQRFFCEYLRWRSKDMLLTNLSNVLK